MQDYVLCALAYVGAARLYLHQGDRDKPGTGSLWPCAGVPLATYVLPWLAVPSGFSWPRST